MQPPDIPSHSVFLDLFERRPTAISSQRKQSGSRIPHSHCEEAFQSGHLLEPCHFPTRQYFSKLREFFSIKISSPKIEAVLDVMEAHSLWESEVKLVSLEFLRCDAKHVQLGWVSLDLEEIVRRSFSMMWILIAAPFLQFSSFLLLFSFLVSFMFLTIRVAQVTSFFLHLL